MLTFKKYVSIWSKIASKRFSMHYRGGTYYNQSAKIRSLKYFKYSEISEFRQLQNMAKTYTSHAFIRTSTALLADSGV